jgi:pilus assembly protein CpaD
MLAEGIEPNQITEGPYDASGARSAPLVISYRTYEAVVPNCPDISSLDFVFTGTNSALPSFGCAVAVNLAAQIGDPSDLVGAQPVDPADIGRRTVVLTKYRNGETTSAARNDDASGAISSAVR